MSRTTTAAKPETAALAPSAAPQSPSPVGAAPVVARQSDPLPLKVRVYFNLHKRVWSVQDARTRRVIAHVDSLALWGVTFKVSQAGRARAVQEGRKNVHAFACGYWDRKAPVEARQDGTAVTYNPFRAGTFVTADEARQPVHGASLALLTGRKVTAYGIR